MVYTPMVLILLCPSILTPNGETKQFSVFKSRFTDITLRFQRHAALFTNKRSEEIE